MPLGLSGASWRAIASCRSSISNARSRGHGRYRLQSKISVQSRTRRFTDDAWERNTLKGLNFLRWSLLFQGHGQGWGGVTRTTSAIWSYTATRNILQHCNVSTKRKKYLKKVYIYANNDGSTSTIFTRRKAGHNGSSPKTCFNAQHYQNTGFRLGSLPMLCPTYTPDTGLSDETSGAV